MNIVHTTDFERAWQKLPQQIKQIYSLQEERFKNNWRDPRLHVKKVRSLEHAFSLRVTRSYRVFFYFQNTDMAIFFDIDHRKDVYR